MSRLVRKFKRQPHECAPIVSDGTASDRYRSLRRWYFQSEETKPPAPLIRCGHRGRRGKHTLLLTRPSAPQPVPRDDKTGVNLKNAFLLTKNTTGGPKGQGQSPTNSGVAARRPLDQRLPACDFQNDLADVSGAFHTGVCLGRLVEWEFGIHDRLDPPRRQ